MTPPLEPRSPDPYPAREPEALRKATEDLRRIGIDEEVVFVGSADEAIAWLAADDPCASSA